MQSLMPFGKSFRLRISFPFERHNIHQVRAR